VLTREGACFSVELCARSGSHAYRTLSSIRSRRSVENDALSGTSGTSLAQERQLRRSLRGSVLSLLYCSFRSLPALVRRHETFTRGSGPFGDRLVLEPARIKDDEVDELRACR